MALVPEAILEKLEPMVLRLIAGEETRAIALFRYLRVLAAAEFSNTRSFMENRSQTHASEFIRAAHARTFWNRVARSRAFHDYTPIAQ